MRGRINNRARIGLLLSGAVALGPYLDGTNLAAAYGVRRVVSGYSGPLYRMVRASDSATMDVYPAGLGDTPDTASIIAWIGASTATVDKLYDQSGNTQDATQTTAANRPSISANWLDGNAGLPICFDSGGSIATPLKWLNLPNTLSLDRLNYSAAMVLSLNSTLANNTLYSFLASGGTAYDEALLTAQGQTGLYSFTQPGTNKSSGIRPRVNRSAIGYTSNSSNCLFYLRETSASATAKSSGTLNNGGTIGGSLSINFNARFAFWCMAFYSVAQSAGTMNANLANLRTVFNVPTVFSARLVLDGDSLTEGQYAEFDGCVANQLLCNNGKTFRNSSLEVFNMGLPGQTSAQVAASIATRSTALYTASVPCGFFCMIGVNSIRTGITAASVETDITTIYNSVHGAGFKTTFCTVLPSTLVAGANETQRGLLNTWINANSIGSDYIADVAGDSTIGNGSTSTGDSTLYADGTHLTRLGQSYFANYGKTYIDLMVP